MLARAKAAASNASVKAKDGKDKGVAKLLTAINNLRPILRAYASSTHKHTHIQTNTYTQTQTKQTQSKQALTQHTFNSGGYAIEAVELTAGVPPAASLELRNVRDVDLEELEALKERENPPLTRFQKGVVAMLIRTEQLESTVRRKKYEIELIIIETGLIPSLTLRLVPQDPTEAGDAEAAAEGKDEETLEDDE